MAEGPQDQETPKSRVCRVLFPPEEGDEPREVGENRENLFLEELNRQQTEIYTTRYNFDFSTETALPGNLEWYKQDSTGKWVRMPVQGEEGTPDPTGTPPAVTSSPPGHPSQ